MFRKYVNNSPLPLTVSVEQIELVPLELHVGLVRVKKLVECELLIRVAVRSHEFRICKNRVFKWGESRTGSVPPGDVPLKLIHQSNWTTQKLKFYSMRMASTTTNILPPSFCQMY